MLSNIQVSCMVIGLCLWFLYLIDALRHTPLQGILVLLMPGYVFYFAIIKSQRTKPFGMLLIVASLLFFLIDITQVIFLD